MYSTLQVRGRGGPWYDHRTHGRVNLCQKSPESRISSPSQRKRVHKICTATSSLMRRLQVNKMKDMKRGVHEMCTIIRPPPTWADSYRQRGWVWTRFYLVPPPPPSFGDDASRVGLGIFILFSQTRDGEVETNLIGATFKKQCPLCGPLGFHSHNNPN